jgi:hypothetical protein
MRRAVVTCAAAFMLASASASLAQEQMFVIVLQGSLNTMGRLFPNPTAADPMLRAQSYTYSDFYGIGVELQYHFANSNVFLGLSSEYVHNTGGRNIAATARSVVPVDDDYRVIPVEITGYFRIPVTSGNFSILMGGGTGMYFGQRYYATAGVEAPTTASRPGFGIHVLGGVAYRVASWFSASMTIKFRDAQFRTTNAFSVSSVKYGEILVPLSRQPFESTVHTDGMVIQVGLGFSI